MAKMLRNKDWALDVEYAAHIAQDRSLTSRDWRLHLLRRMRFAEFQIRRYVDELGPIQDGDEYLDWDEGESGNDYWAAWANLNYWLQAREKLRKELDAWNGPTN